MAASDDRAVREACTIALGQIKPPAVSAAAVPDLIEGLSNPDRDVRVQVVALLSRLGSDARPAIPALIKTLKEPVNSDRVVSGGAGGAATSTYAGPAHDAAKLLGRIAPGTGSATEVIAALADVVRSGARQRAASAAKALGEFGTSAAETVPDLIEMLKADDPSQTSTPTHAGEAAAAALARIAAGTDGASTQAALAALETALSAQSRHTRAAAIRALQKFGPKAADALPQIKALMDDPDSRVRKAASEAIETLDGHSPTTDATPK